MNHLYLILFCFVVVSCVGQTKNRTQELSADFDRSPPIYYGMPKDIKSKDVSPAWKLDGQKLLLTGTVFQSDGKTPAADLLLYYYQTNLEGRYIHDKNETRSMPPNELGQTHGYIRGWVRTDKQGKYSIKTIRPGSYPSGNEVAHIHAYVADPAMARPYYIDDFVFDDDRTLTTNKRQMLKNRGGSGVLRMFKKGNIYVGERDIILGLNIPDYPVEQLNAQRSGMSIGENIFSFTPTHVWGPDVGSKICPMCKYGWYHGVLYFVGNQADWYEINQWLSFLETESLKRKQYLKVFFVYGADKGLKEAELRERLKSIGEEMNLEQLALTFVPSFQDENSKIHLNRINPEVENTIILYKRGNVIDNFINLKPTASNFKILSHRLDETINDFNHSLAPPHQSAR